jgi:hypothetical protein
MLSQGYLKVPKEERQGPFLARMRKNLIISESEEWPRMNYNTLQEAMEQAGWCQQIDALSVYRAFEHIQDRSRLPTAGTGARHARSTRAMGDWKSAN